MREPIVGETLDHYELLDLLARSGMASIFKAKDKQTGAIVVLKVPHLQYESDVVFYERFQREEKMCQKLDHPHIVKVMPPEERSRMYLVMEFVPGRSLRAIMQEKRRLSVEEILTIARQVTEALVYMHEKRVVHRDIKPENILITPDETVKLLDFGIALDESARRLTWAGLSNTLGTPDYMAPEQVGGRRGDARTDVYAVGMLLYEALTGELPFSAPNAQALMRAKTTESPRAPTYHVPDLDPHIENLILRAIARSPKDRYPTAAALLEDLRHPEAVRPLEDFANSGAARVGTSVRFAKRAAVLAIFAGLGFLVWLSHRYAESGGRPLSPGS